MNERDGGRVIVIGVDVVGFVDIQDVRSRVERGCAPMEGLGTFVHNHGHYMQTEQIEEEVG